MKILVVENDTDTLQQLLRILTREGHRVEASTTLREAFKLLPRGYDAMISGMALPDGSSRFLMQAASQQDIRGIALSAVGSSKDTAVATAEFSAHLVKPFSVVTVLQALKDAMK